MMNEDEDVLQSHIVLDRCRNPAFGKEEVEALVKLIEKYKTIILNKSTITAVNHAKEAAWIKIAEVYNNQGFRHTRTVNCLKTKWENLKKSAKKVSYNLMDPTYDEFNDLTNPVVALLCEAEMSSNIFEIPEEIREELKQVGGGQKINNLEKISDNYNKPESDNSDGENESRKMRSLNFSPEESSLLLKCVNEEQKFVFCKENTKNAIQLKKKAWSRITDAFNKKSPRKRSTITLQTKFGNMKRNVKDQYFKNYLLGKKHKRLVEEEIKAEPQFESKLSDMDHEDNNGDDSDEVLNDVLPHFDITHQSDTAPDPISSAFGNESGADGDYEFKRNRSLNFSPYEVSVLLKCVREEHKHLFTKNQTTRAIHQKNKAWTRITEAFNKATQQQRSTRVLRTKFDNLKKTMGRSYFRACVKSNGHDYLEEQNSKAIKAESGLEYRSESEDNDEADDDVTHDAVGLSAGNSPERAPDPLATVLSSDSGLGSTSFIGAYNFGNNEVTKLKLELLKYQLENAKLERERLQETMRAEATARDSLTVERCLRLRAARLEAVAAGLRLPPAHPALRYTPEEAPAEQYMNQYEQ